MPQQRTMSTPIQRNAKPAYDTNNMGNIGNRNGPLRGKEAATKIVSFLNLPITCKQSKKKVLYSRFFSQNVDREDKEKNEAVEKMEFISKLKDLFES